MTDEVRPSPELQAVVRRWISAMRNRDAATVMNLMSTSDYLRYVGTDPTELWSGRILRQGFADHVAELPVYDVEEHHLEAFEQGGVGWACWSGSLYIEGAEAPQPTRFTLVFILEMGAWKLIQKHSSFPAPNAVVHGSEHKAINALVEAVAQGFDLTQREGLATILFTDIVDSSAMAIALGDRDWAQRIAGHFAEMETIVADAGGEVVKSLGDGTMSSFSSSRAALMAARNMQMRAASDGREPKLALRIGLHSGDVIQTSDDFFGSVVNKAARITGIADAGEIRVSDDVRIAVVGDKDCTFSRPLLFALKGFEGETLTHALDWSERRK